jgi:hypothetical protein
MTACFEFIQQAVFSLGWIMDGWMMVLNNHKGSLPLLFPLLCLAQNVVNKQIPDIVLSSWHLPTIQYNLAGRWRMPPEDPYVDSRDYNYFWTLSKPVIQILKCSFRYASS